MGGTAGAILIILMVAAGAYCYWKTSNNTGQEGVADNRTWKEKYLPWGASGGEHSKDPNNGDKDEFHDEENGETKPNAPAKSWGDAFYDQVMKVPSPSDLKMMMFKKGLSQSV